jgi:Rrf2 family protein
MRISAKVDYAVRGAIELAAAGDGATVSAERISQLQGIPLNFLIHILDELQDAGLVRVEDDGAGGYRLANSADEVTIADIIRAVEGPLTTVRGVLPEDAAYAGAADELPRVWIALRQNVRNVVEHVTLSALVSKRLPTSIDRLAGESEAWVA